MYDEALRKLKARRADAGQASKAAFDKLDEQARAAYAKLDNEAYVNKALSDRAYGTAEDRITTIRQRRESNLRNTLGKNERQRQSFEGSVDLALRNYETRQTADDAALTAQYGAAEDAAFVSQGNFDTQLGLKQQKLEFDKQSSQIDHAYKLYARGMIDRGEFKDMTGIEVRKLPSYRKVIGAYQGYYGEIL